MNLSATRIWRKGNFKSAFTVELTAQTRVSNRFK